MGGVGSGSAIEASDIVVMTDSIDRIDCAIDISKKTSKTKLNILYRSKNNSISTKRIRSCKHVGSGIC